MRYPVEQFVGNQGIRHITCKRTQPQLSNDFVRSHRGYKILCISAVLPSREQRYYVLIELEPKAFCLKAHQISKVALLGGLIFFDLLVAVANKKIIPNLIIPKKIIPMEEEDHTSHEVTDPPKLDNE